MSKRKWRLMQFKGICGHPTDGTLYFEDKKALFCGKCFDEAIRVKLRKQIDKRYDGLADNPYRQGDSGR